MSNTALITGASSGIGAELARLHASRGGDLVLVARSEEKLRELKQELESAYDISAAVIPADLAQPNASSDVFAKTRDAEITVDILVNNAGFGGHGKFHERDLAAEHDMMQVNMTALIDLTHWFLPGMIERKSGKILQVASTAGMIPGPLQAVYFASKAFVLSFSQALSEELDGSGVTCTALCPGAVDTGFARASDLEDIALFKKPGAPAASVAKCGYEAMQRGELVAFNDSIIKFALNWVIPLLPRRTASKISRQSMEKA